MLMHDSSQCPICGASLTLGSMSDGQFSAFLAACRNELAGVQARFQQRIRDAGQWFYDLSDCTLRIGGQSFSITPIGTYSAEYQSWLWAWANDEFPLLAREASKRLQTLHTVTGFHVFTNPGIGASANEADDFVALSVHSLGAIGFFRVPSESRQASTLFLAVHERTDSKCDRKA
jgi:hypothetical protein